MESTNPFFSRNRCIAPVAHLNAERVPEADRAPASLGPNEQERAQVGKLAQAVQETTGQSVEIAFVDQGYTGEAADEAAKAQGIELSFVKLPETKKGGRVKTEGDLLSGNTFSFHLRGYAVFGIVR